MGELRIDYEPGYRVYFVRKGDMLVPLLMGGDNRTSKPILPEHASLPQPGSRTMSIETSRWDAADYLDSESAILAYLEAVFEDGDPELITLALDNVARARGVATEALNSQFDISVIIRTMKALGLELTAKAA